MKILAIETSCDDTGIAILEVSKTGNFSAYGGPAEGWKVLSNIISSQIEVHKKYGGVYPAMAKREHQRNLVPVLMQALGESKLLNPLPSGDLPKGDKSQIPNTKSQTIKNILKKEEELFAQLKKFLEKYEKPDIDLIAVTNGPGLEPCLWVGVNFAKALSFFWNIPVVSVDHIESHILVNFVDLNSKIKNQKSKLQFKIQNLFPAICLVVSGGHTQLILMKGIGKYQILGETRDDAAGECFDKAAKILGLGYPGGPIIAKLAEEIRPPREGQISIKLPRPMINTKDYDFSFSGLKTAVLYKVKEYKNSTTDWSMVLSKKFVKEMCIEVQQAIIDVLLKKTIKAARDYKAKAIILGGGVSANKELRRQLAEKIQKDTPNTKYLIPDTALSTDNALMIAIAGYFHKNKKTESWGKLKAEANLRIC